MEVDRDVTWDRWQEEMAALICHRQRQGPGARARWIPLAQTQTSHKVNGHYGGEVKLLIRLHSTSKYSSDFSRVINCWIVLYNNICQHLRVFRNFNLLYDHLWTLLFVSLFISCCTSWKLNFIFWIGALLIHKLELKGSWVGAVRWQFRFPLSRPGSGAGTR